VITRTYRGTDACGNQATCTQIITVNDTTPPVATCPAALTIECGNPIPPPSLSSVIATDNCDSAPVVSHVGDVSNGQSCPQVITRTYRVTDACGNSTTCTQTLTVRDTTPPFATGTLPSRVVSCDSQIPAPVQPSMSDACDSTLTYSVQTITQISSGSCGKTRLYRWTIRDDCTNTTIRIQTISIRDRTAPAITCPLAVTLSGDANCQAVLPPLTATATDNCGGTPVITQNPPTGTLLGPGAHTVTFTAVDACGNTQTCTTTVTVNCPPPALLVLKSVYPGHDGGASCPGIELVSGLMGSPVTYCFYVVNNGQTLLNNVTLTDPLLGIAPINVGTLTPGQSALRHVESSISADLVNTVTATGTPPSGPPVSSVDPAEVKKVTPAIDLQKTVRNGANAACPGVEEISSLTKETNTYCFTVTNMGNVELQNVEISDPDLEIAPIFIGSLLPGQAMSAKVDDICQGSLTNVASVIGYPPFGPPVNDADPAVVFAAGPGLDFNKTVYAGHNGGAGCPGVEFLAFSGPTQVTYCFRVRNTGDSALYDVVINDASLGIINLPVGDMLPGDEVTRFAEIIVSAPVTNLATAAGDPPSGLVVQVPDQAVIAAYNPSLQLNLKVFAGHGPASGCAAAGDTLTAPLNSPLTYCFEVVNTGDTHLNNIGIGDPRLSINEGAMSYINGLFPLPPGQSLLYTYQGLVQGTMTNTAAAAASATTPLGLQIRGLPNPTDVDAAVIQATIPAP
jgi:hypothetical protein